MINDTTRRRFAKIAEKVTKKPSKKAAGFGCPECGAVRGKVIDSRQRGSFRYRRYRCPNSHHYTTYETVFLDYVPTYEI